MTVQRRHEAIELILESQVRVNPLFVPLYGLVRHAQILPVEFPGFTGDLSDVV
jgi:hypothetical protein